MISYFLAAIVNTGIEMKGCGDNEIEANDDQAYCSICGVYKSDKTEHCEECGVCIKEYDHHCPWTSKCIGKGNILFFYCFISSLLISFIFGLANMVLLTKDFK